jgi:N-acetylglucosaminyl-diphospho-decaprenol L-rhamnosyltransferase
MDLSIIIVNWNSTDLLHKCISSIKAETGGVYYEIVVIDSGSFDGCDKMLQRCYPEVHFIQSDSNIGFAKANNEAFKISCGRNLLFLNPDTIVTDSAINKLTHHLRSLTFSGAVGARLLNRDGSVQTSCIRAFPTILNQFIESDVLRRWFPCSNLWGMAPLFEKSEDPKEVDAVSGACMMIKRSVFESIGMFSTDYFMYSEDIDICLKIQAAGLKTYYVPMAVVYHFGDESSSKSKVNAFSSVMMIESRWRFFKKTHSLWHSRLYRLGMLFASALRIGLAFCLWPIGAMCGKASLLESVVKKWMPRLRWALGGEGWVKKYGGRVK